MSRKISITAVIPTIGNNDFLINSINSIINQKKPFNEIIVFDNSQDKELKKSIPQSIIERVKWIISKSRLPCYESWNQAVNNSSESHIFVMGDDDIALDNLSEICFKIAKDHDFALLKGFIIDSKGNRIGKLPYEVNNNEIGIQEYIKRRSWGQIATVFPGTLYSKDIFNKLEGYKNSEISGWAFTDEFFILRFLRNGGSIKISENYCWEYRVHKDQIPVVFTNESYLKERFIFLKKLFKAGFFEGLDKSVVNGYTKYVLGYMSSCLGQSLGKKRDIFHALKFVFQSMTYKNISGDFKSHYFNNNFRLLKSFIKSYLRKNA